MSPIEIEVIRRKLTRIADNLRALEPIEDLSREEYIADLYKRKATERLLQELIEAAVDINVHILTQMGHPAPDDYYESFTKMGELKIIPSDLAAKLAPSAGLRNRLVHEYDRLNDAMVFEAVKMAGEIFPQYIRAVNGFISGTT